MVEFQGTKVCKIWEGGHRESLGGRAAMKQEENAVGEGGDGRKEAGSWAEWRGAELPHCSDSCGVLQGARAL